MPIIGLTLINLVVIKGIVKIKFGCSLVDDSK
jgi:hypothetical protein